MDVMHERRVTADRRRSTVPYPHEDRRARSGNRRANPAVATTARRLRVRAPREVESPDRAARIVNEVAAAFGVDPQTLIAVEGDDYVDNLAGESPDEATPPAQFPDDTREALRRSDG